MEREGCHQVVCAAFSRHRQDDSADERSTSGRKTLPEQKTAPIEHYTDELPDETDGAILSRSLDKVSYHTIHNSLYKDLSERWTEIPLCSMSNFEAA